MKFFVPLLAVAEATITLNLDKLTNFDAVAHLVGDQVQVSPVERVTFAGDVKVSVDLFKGQLSWTDSGTSSTAVDCKGLEGKIPACRAQLTPQNFLDDMKKAGAGELFIDAATGKMGLKGHESGAHGSDGGFEVNFCAVVHLPVKSYPPPSMLRQTLNAQMLARAQAKFNQLPHSEEGGVATFSLPEKGVNTKDMEQGYSYSRGSWKMHTDGGDPIEVSEEAGWRDGGLNGRYHAGSGAAITFSSWTSPASAVKTFSCPGEGTTTDIHAHPAMKGSLAALNTVVLQLRQSDDFAWLPENPASYFIEQVEKQRDEDGAPEEAAEESQDSLLSPMVASFFAGVSGGAVVLAFFLFAQKRRRQEPLLSEA